MSASPSELFAFAARVRHDIEPAKIGEELVIGQTPRAMRRRKIALLLPLIVIAALGALAGCVRRPAGEPRGVGIPEIRSSDGVAHVVLDAVLTTRGTPAFAYAGAVGVAPTIRVKPGDRIDIVLHNRMHAQRSRSNDVNLHFHGLAVSPHAPGDDVLMTVAHPGQTVHYRVRVPADHEPGLYWYHSHIHGQTFWQVVNGLSGVIVVEGIERHLPALAAMRERIIVLRQQPTGRGENAAPAATFEEAEGMNGQACRPEIALRPTIDGQSRERFEIGRGEQQFFRVVNASASRYFDLSIDGVPIQLVALDGVPLDAYPGAAPVLTVNHVVIAPAGRAEFVVVGPRDSRIVRAWCVDSGPAGDAQPPRVLGELVIRPGAPASPLPLTIGAPLRHNALSEPAPPPAARRTIRLTEDAHHFYINGRTFTMSDMMGPAAVVARGGTVEEWNVVNATDEVHDFHIHQVHFVAESIDGAAVSPRYWADTVNVPAQSHHGVHITPGTARLLVDFRNPVVRGRFPFHCHILDHEDRGMMAIVEVR